MIEDLLRWLGRFIMLVVGFLCLVGGAVGSWLVGFTSPMFLGMFALGVYTTYLLCTGREFD